MLPSGNGIGPMSFPDIGDLSGSSIGMPTYSATGEFDLAFPGL